MKPTARFEIHFQPSVRKDLRGVPKPTVRRILAAIARLAANPRPPQCAKLKGRDDLYRIRAGPYRVIYQIQDHERRIVVRFVDHRRNVYRSA